MDVTDQDFVVAIGLLLGVSSLLLLSLWASCEPDRKLPSMWEDRR